MGTTSATAYYWLKEAGLKEEHLPALVGGITHELPMVLAALYGDKDDLAKQPISQAIAHACYFHFGMPKGDVQDKKRKMLMPMLPDTLGVKAFLKIAHELEITHGVHKGEPFLDMFGVAIMDSGHPLKFAELLYKYGFKGHLLTSEVETDFDLFVARDCGFTQFLAGGYFGDDYEPWYGAKPASEPMGPPSTHNIRMVNKVVRVKIGGERTEYHPVKLADPPEAAQLATKVAVRGEIDKATTMKVEIKFEADGVLRQTQLVELLSRSKQLAGVEEDLGKREADKRKRRSTKVVQGGVGDLPDPESTEDKDVQKIFESVMEELLS